MLLIDLYTDTIHLSYNCCNAWIIHPQVLSWGQLFMCFYNQLLYSSTDILVPFRQKLLKVQQTESAETTRDGCNASNFLLSWSLNVCTLSLPLHHRINLLFHLLVPPPSRSLIHLISALWLVQSPPPFSAGSSSFGAALLAAPYSGAVVSPVESDCAGGREVNWKKLRCSHRGAEARGNKLDISPIHVGWRVYTIYPPHYPLSPLPPPSIHTCTLTQSFTLVSRSLKK